MMPAASDDFKRHGAQSKNDGHKRCCRERRRTDSVLQCGLDQQGGIETVSSSNCREASSGLSEL